MKSEEDESKPKGKKEKLTSAVLQDNNAKDCKKNNEKLKEKKKKKRNWWPLKALGITFVLAAAVNAVSELALEDAQIWLTYAITAAILIIGVFFDIIGTASTACNIEPFLAMASRKVKGAKLAVRLCQHNDSVSSICNDIVGDICGIVSGICAATIVATQIGVTDFWLSILVYAVISTLTVTLKAFGKSYAVNNANKIVFSVAKFLSIFSKEG